MQDVEGKVAFITGGASGIGLGMAKAFAKAGMKCVVADLRDDHIEQARAWFDDAGPRRTGAPLEARRDRPGRRPPPPPTRPSARSAR